MSNSDISLARSVAAKGHFTLLDTVAPQRTMAMIISLYCVFWMALTVMISPVVPYDAVEAWHWGQGFEAGSPKNPWLVGGVAALARYLPLSWPTYWYASHFLALGAGAWGCWKLCQRLITDTRHAMLCVVMMVLSGTVSIDLLPYNDNYLLMMLWPWIAYSFIRALYDDRRYWLLVTVIMALAGMAKYSTAIFLPFMLLAVIWQRQLMNVLKQPWLWGGLLIGLVLVAPNLYWLSQHDYAAFRWFSTRIGGESAWSVVRVYSAVFYNVVLIIGVLWVARWRWQFPVRSETRTFIMLVIAPVIVLGGYFIAHGGVRTEWMMPFAVPVGLAVAMCMVPPARGGYRIPLSICYGVVAVTLCGFTTSKVWDGIFSSRARTHVPELSVALDNWWKEHYQQTLVYAGGSRVGDWIGIYAPDHPRTPTRWPSAATIKAAQLKGLSPYPNIFTPGLTEEQLLQHGAMWVGEVDSLCSNPSVLELDPSLSTALRQRIEYHTLIFHQNDMSRVNFSLCVGVLPPHA